MKRRSFLKTIGASAIAATAPVVFASNQPIILKFQTFMNSQSLVWQTMLVPWMKKVEKESQGRIRFQEFPSMQGGGNPNQLYDNIKNGVMDVGWALPGWTAGRFPKVEAFELPFMMTNAESTSKAFWEYINIHAKDEFKDVQLLAAHTHGPGLFHTNKKLIKTVDDMKGLKIRGSTRQITKMLSALGASPVGLPLPSVAEALSKNVIEGCALPWEVLPSIRAHELTKFHTEFPENFPGLYTATFILAMNKDKYLSLPKDLQSVIDKNSGIETSAWLGKTQQSNDPAGKSPAVERGNIIHKVSIKDAIEFKNKSSIVNSEWIEEMNKKGFEGEKLLQAAQDLINKHTLRNKK